MKSNSSSRKNSLSYRDAGVNRDRADRLVEKIQKLTGAVTPLEKKLKRGLRSSIGGYASVYALSSKQWIAATTDGVGTKLKLAIELGDHSTIGQDLVAMSVNDLICVGALPTLFLDYFATAKLDSNVAAEVISGISRACREAGCLLVGGETAEMPGLYQEGDYDLAGFAVGALAPGELLPKKKISVGSRLIGVASSGFHSNGYSLLRRLAAESSGKVPVFGSREKLKRALLTPTALYPAVLRSRARAAIQGMAHITGSGFLNLPRISEKVAYEVTLPPLSERAPVFRWLNEAGSVRFHEAAQTFNLGLGLILNVAAKDESRVLKILQKEGFRAWSVGEVVRGKGQVRVSGEEGTAELG